MGTDMSENMHTLVIVVPESLEYQAGQLALLLGTSQADERTFRDFGWRDEQGNTFAVSAPVVSAEWIESAENPEPKEGVDMGAALEAHGLLQWDSATPSADHITVVMDVVPTEAVADFGLTYEPDREENEND